MSTAVVERLNAALSGRYRIESELGQGGMATVYLADDVKHERKVALKVLKPELAAVVGADRFLAEIKTTANLQHPHILPLYDSGQSEGFLYYVMPFIEGETLADRLERERQLPVDEAVRIASDVAEALHSAHEQGVIHRDVKPANILLSQGRPLVADFGIALAVSAAGGGRLTETGLSMGTPYYMSPEQAAADRDPSAASDVYSLACVLYEMLVGEPPHTGTSAQAVLAKILTDEAPAPTQARPSIPANVDAAIRRALEKLPADRFRGADEFRRALANPGFVHGAVPSESTGAVGSTKWRRVSAALGATTVTLGVALGLAVWPRAEPAPTPIRMGLTGLELRAPGGSGVRLAVSSDGTQLAMASVVDGVSRLFVRRIDASEWLALPGTEGSTHPAFSPDGLWLAFTQESDVRRTEVAGGPVLQVIGEGQNPHWGLQGTLAVPTEGDIVLVSPEGENERRFSISDSANADRPFMLPGGRLVVFQLGSDAESAQLMLLDTESGEVGDLGLTGNDPQYVPTGHIVYGHGSDRLMAVPFDVRRGRVTGPPATVAPQVLVYGGGATQFAVSETGTALIGVGARGAEQGRELVAVDLRGEQTALPIDPGYYTSARYAPDGRSVAYVEDGGLYVYDLETGANRALGPASSAIGPVWSPAGGEIYSASRTPAALGYDGFVERADGASEEEHVYRRERNNYPVSVSPDGTTLLIQESNPGRGMDLMLVSLDDPERTVSDFLRADWNEITGMISPDGERVAYASDQTGAYEVWVRSFPSAEDGVRISEEGGKEPVWAPDGSAVFYRDGIRIIKATISTEPPYFVQTREVVLEGLWMPGDVGTTWDVHPDGDSFLLITSPGAEVDGDAVSVSLIEVEIVVNWFEELKRLMGN